MFIHAANSILVFLFMFIQRLEMKDELSCLLNFKSTDQFRMSYSKDRTYYFAHMLCPELSLYSGDQWFPKAGHGSAMVQVLSFHWTEEK